jgi:hypothetical protein
VSAPLGAGRRVFLEAEEGEGDSCRRAGESEKRSTEMSREGVRAAAR